MALRSSKSAHTPDFRGEKTETCDQDSTLADVTAASNHRGEHPRYSLVVVSSRPLGMPNHHDRNTFPFVTALPCLPSFL